VLVVLEAVMSTAGEQLGCFDPAISLTLEYIDSAWLIPGHPGLIWRANCENIIPQGDRSAKALRWSRPQLTLELGGRNYR
jgi:hypothetical protein